jgi:hypothetical protein
VNTITLEMKVITRRNTINFVSLTVFFRTPCDPVILETTPQNYSAESVSLNERMRGAELPHRGIKTIILTVGSNTNSPPKAGFYLRTV